MMVQTIYNKNYGQIEDEFNKSRSAANEITKDGSELSALMYAISIGNNYITKVKVVWDTSYKHVNKTMTKDHDVLYGHHLQNQKY